MKVLFLNTERGWRGGERQTLLAMMALRSKNVAVELVARADSVLADAAREEGFVVHTGFGFFSLLIWLFSVASRFDVLHAHTAFTASVLAGYRFFKNKPTLFTRRTDFVAPGRAWLRRLKWRQFDRVIAISHSAAREPIRVGVRPILVRSSVPTVVQNPTRVQSFLKQNGLIGKTRIGTAAVFTADKDPLTCIEAAAQLCARNDNVVFLHWGDGGDLEKICKNYVNDIGLEKQYLFLGFMPNPEELYASLSAFVLTSRIEALGTCVLDAMVQRVPVVATSVGGLKETLASGRGYLVPSENPTAIAESIEWVLTHRAESAQVAETAYAFVRRKHDVNKMASRYYGLYLTLVSGLK